MFLKILRPFPEKMLGKNGFIWSSFKQFEKKTVHAGAVKCGLQFGGNTSTTGWTVYGASYCVYNPFCSPIFEPVFNRISYP